MTKEYNLTTEDIDILNKLKPSPAFSTAWIR